MIKKWLINKDFSADNESRRIKQGLKIIRCLSKAEVSLTIPIIAENVKLSVPTVTRLIGELKAQNLVVEEGKITTDSGRKPIVYAIKREQFYSIGVEILLGKIQISIVSIDLQIKYKFQDSEFKLENTEACRNEVCKFIKDAIVSSKLSNENIIGIGIGLTGRVNSSLGKTYNFFEFDDVSFASYVSKELGFPVIVENDTRVVGLYEFVVGKAKNITNALIVNISSGVGMTLIANKRIITGESGFAGEFGHMQFVGNKNRLCICGKRGCLDTEVSGKALEVFLNEAVVRGEKSLLLEHRDSSVHYEEIIDAATNGDVLAITLLQKQGEKLGLALGNIINLLNPEIIIISGKYARIDDFFRNSVKTALYTTGLKDPLRDCDVVNSEFTFDAGSIGAAALVFKKYDLI